jgi:hypothetical protein
MIPSNFQMPSDQINLFLPLFVQINAMIFELCVACVFVCMHAACVCFFINSEPWVFKFPISIFQIVLHIPHVHDKMWYSLQWFIHKFVWSISRWESWFFFFNLWCGEAWCHTSCITNVFTLKAFWPMKISIQWTFIKQDLAEISSHLNVLLMNLI